MSIHETDALAGSAAVRPDERVSLASIEAKIAAVSYATTAASFVVALAALRYASGAAR